MTAWGMASRRRVAADGTAGKPRLAKVSLQSTMMPSVRVALISSLEPVFAALWAALLLNEQLSGRELLGGGLIVLGVAVGEAGAAIWKAA